LNFFGEDAMGSRTSIDLLAPGVDVEVAAFDDAHVIREGTSFAAPHVTGTVALLQEHAENQIANLGAPRWDADARRHEVMKAVLMNSADKIEDDGAIEPVGSFLGMERTVLKQNGTDTWFDSNAHNNPNIPLDIEMGTGHLNANRAFQQFDPGEFDPGNVPLIGWDYDEVDDLAVQNKYVFNQPLAADSYVSLTLAWDREWFLDELEQPIDGEYAPGDQFINDFFEDLNLYLLPAGATNVNQAIAESTSDVQNVEHIFAQIPTTGNYEFWVTIPDEFIAEEDYAIAWWAAGVSNPDPSAGDYDGNGTVGPEDYLVWKSNFGTTNPDVDGNGDGLVNAADYVHWRNILVASGTATSSVVPVPEAGGGVLPVVAALVVGSVIVDRGAAKS
jgi:subtilisin family serine protease